MPLRTVSITRPPTHKTPPNRLPQRLLEFGAPCWYTRAVMPRVQWLTENLLNATPTAMIVRVQRKRRCITLFAFVILGMLAAAEAEALTITDWCTEHAPDLVVEVRSRSGSPLLLEFLINDPELALERLTIESTDSTASFKVPETEEIDIKLTAFHEAGVHDITVTMETETGSCTRELQVAFSDFVWGRDNFRFSNKRSPHGSVRPYSRVLFPWAEERFGTLQPEEKTVLLDFTYALFGGRIGRCYAFTGSQVRFRRNSDLLPSYYDSIYAVREATPDVQDQMNMLQNDIMFKQFVSRGYDLDTEQSLESLRSETSAVIDEIAAGRVAAFGYVAPQRHHSMLAYGYLTDSTGDRITLIVANNWGEEHDQNIFSEAAERVAIHLDEDYEGHRVQWVDTSHRVYEYAEHFFFVDIPDEYEYEHKALSELVAERRARLRETQHALVVVEQARDAVLADQEGTKSGRVGRRTYRDLESVSYRRVEDVHVFEFPAEHALTLRVSPLEDNSERPDETKANVFVLTHPTKNGVELVHSAVYTELDRSETEELRLRIAPEGLKVTTKPANESE